MATNLVITPLEAPFELPAIRHRLDSQPDTFEDPRGTGYYVITGHPAGVPHGWRYRQADSSSFPGGALVVLTNDMVLMNQEYAGEDALRSAMDVARWLWTRFACAIREDGFADLTEGVRQHGVESLYPAYVRKLPLAWEGTLIRIGFFRELDHGDGSDFSLEELAATTAGPDEEELAAYLESGLVYRTVDQIARDMLADDPDEAPIGPLRLLTDGTYVWPSDLPYYLRSYHLQLPRAFIIHARESEFRIPAPLDVTRLIMLE